MELKKRLEALKKLNRQEWVANRKADNGQTCGFIAIMKTVRLLDPELFEALKKDGYDMSILTDF